MELMVMSGKKGLKDLIAPCLLAFLLLPFLVLLLWAFTRQWPAASIFPSQFGLRGWSYVFAPYSKVLSSLWLSVLLSLAVTVLSILISFPAGKALGLDDFPGKSVVEILVLAPIIIPPIAVGMGLDTTFIKYGLTDTFVGVLLVQLVVVLPYGIRIFASAYKAIGRKWDDQARVLKASWWQRFIWVTLPFMYPALAASIFLMFNVSFSQYFLTFLIGGGQVVTLPLLLFPYLDGGDRVIASAISLLFIVAALSLTIVIENTMGDRKEQSELYYL
jgi:putative spermidine/putrescine transport system permease protein